MSAACGIARRKLDKFARAAILHASPVLRTAGFSTGEQAEVFGISKDTLYGWLRRTGSPTSGCNTRAVHRYILTGRYHRAA